VLLGDDLTLTIELFEQWLSSPPPLGPKTEAERTRWRERWSDPRQRPWYFAVVERGALRAVVYLTGKRERAWLVAPRVADGRVDEAVASMVDQAIARARFDEIAVVQMQLPREMETEPLLAAIARTGGVADGGRIEFMSPLEGLPREEDSPITWRPARDRDATAALYAATSVGSADGLGEGEVAREAVDAWLASPFVREPEKVLHIGSVDGRDIALVCAQVNPEDGCCGITYMGLVPEARGRRLGHFVHRHGLDQLRAQGGITYHDGTSLENEAMRACFVRQGVAEMQRFHAYRWQP
jgi:hypothetical protein